MSLIYAPDVKGTAQRTARRNLAAEVRGHEEGHLCRIDHERGLFLVRSDSGPRTYELTAHAFDGLLVVGCTCPAGVKRRNEPGRLICKHASKVARRLERHGLARFDGTLWRGGEA